MFYSKITLIVISVLVISGCLKTINPVFREKDLVSNPLLAGTWVVNEKSEKYRVTADSGKSYTISIIKADAKEPAMFSDKIKGRLGKIGKNLYLETYAEKGYTDLSAYDLPCYLFCRINFVDSNKIAIAWPDMDSLMKHDDLVKKDDRGFLSSNTDALQKFILKMDDRYFRPPDTLIRDKEAVK
jgi:hypothetical protein